jgi:hypothetical protein
MPTYFYKTVMVILLCLIFIGQAVASSTMFYKMNSMSTMNNMSHMMANMHANMDSDENASADCCEQECQCSASGCSAPSIFSKTFTPKPLITSAAKIYSHNTMLPEQRLTSLFRPPILR